MYWFQYPDRIEHLHFATKEEASWYAHNEGDHLIAWGEL